MDLHLNQPTFLLIMAAHLLVISLISLAFGLSRRRRTQQPSVWPPKYFHPQAGDYSTTTMSASAYDHTIINLTLRSATSLKQPATASQEMKAVRSTREVKPVTTSDETSKFAVHPAPQNAETSKFVLPNQPTDAGNTIDQTSQIPRP